MLVCPHCSKEIEVKEPKKEVSWWIYDGIGASRASGGGSLGCGTLILIAIIVAIIVAVFSGSNDNDIYTLSQKVDELTVLVEEIHRSISDTP